MGIRERTDVDMVLLAIKGRLSEDDICTLQTCGWTLHWVEGVPPVGQVDVGYYDQYTKVSHRAVNPLSPSQIKLWGLTQYERVLYVDLDVLPMRRLGRCVLGDDWMYRASHSALRMHGKGPGTGAGQGDSLLDDIFALDFEFGMANNIHTTGQTAQGLGGVFTLRPDKYRAENMIHHLSSGKVRWTTDVRASPSCGR